MSIERVDSLDKAHGHTVLERWEELTPLPRQIPAGVRRRHLWENLLPPDMTFVHDVTGQTAAAVIEGRERPVSMLGTLIASDRLDQTLPATHLVDEDYLIELLQRTHNPMRPEESAVKVRDIRAAIAHLRMPRTTGGGIDFSA